MLLRPLWTVVTIAPFLALQEQHVKTFTDLGIATIAINKETPPNLKPKIMKDALKGAYQHIIVSPEQCARSCTETPTFSKLLEDQTFRTRIRCVNYDEAHFVVTAGEPDKEGNIFRPEYANGYDLLIRLKTGIPCTLFSATLPKQILDKVMKSLRLPTSTSRTTYLSLTTNRPNLSFSIRQLSSAETNFSNLDLVLPSSYHPPMALLPKTLIFVKTTNMSVDLERRINKMYPGYTVAQRIHSSLSAGFKTQIISNYLSSESKPPILIATTVLSNGFDPQDVEVVIIYGTAAKDTIEFEQMAGRGGRDGHTKCLVLFLPESWLFKSKSERDAEGLSNQSKIAQTSEDLFNYAQTDSCLRGFLADLNNDTTDHALDFTGPFCCDSKTHTGSEKFSIRYWMPNARCFDQLKEPQVSNAQSFKQTPRATYRPTHERGLLEDKIKAWRTKVHRQDRFIAFFPVEHILDTKDINLLVRLPRDTPVLTSEDTLASFVHWSAERKGMYAQELLKLITDYNLSLPPERKAPRKSEPTPFAQYCSVINFGNHLQATSSQAQTQTTPPSQSSLSSVIDFRIYSEATSSQAQTQNLPPSQSSLTTKHSLAENEGNATRKRARRNALGEISLNH